MTEKITKRNNDSQKQSRLAKFSQTNSNNNQSSSKLNHAQTLPTFRPINNHVSHTNRSPNKLSSQKEQTQSHNSIQIISAVQNQLNDQINKLDFRLKNNYHQKQEQLISSYKEQLIKAHKDLIELKNNTNQQQIRNQMNQKAFQLKKQRLQLIQVNMFYSNKCLQYKKKLDQVIMQGSQLERQLKFLQKQLQNSTDKRIKLMAQVYDKNSILNKNNQQLSQYKLKRKYEKEQTIRQMQTKRTLLQSIGKKTSLSTHANTQTMRKGNKNSNSNSKVKKSNAYQISEFDEEVKKLFSGKLLGENVQNNKKYQYSFNHSSSELPLSKLTKINFEQNESLLNNNEPVNEIKQIEKLFMQSVADLQQKKHSKKQIGLFKGQQFSDFEKKQIMKNFLSKEEVKQYIYSIIFDKVDDQNIFKKKNHKQKVKIYATDINSKTQTQELN